jgi:ribose transport system permease protein
MSVTVVEPRGVGEAQPTVRSAPSHARSVGALVSRFGLVGLLIAAIAFFSLWSRTGPVFASRANIENLLADQTVVMVMALGVMVPLIVGGFDFSIGATTGVASIVTAASISRFDASFVVAIAFALVVGALIGTVNGLAVSRLRLNPFIITLAVSTVLTGLVQWYSNGLSISARGSDTLVELGSGKLAGIPITTYVLVIVSAAVWYVLEHIPPGRRWRAHGVNPDAASLVGINVRATVLSAYIVGGMLGAAAGVVLAARNGAANPGDGTGLLFAAIAAVFLGTTAIRPGQFNVVGTVVGVFFVACCVSGLNLAGVKPWVQPVFTGAALAVAVTISTLGLRRHAR